MKSIIQDLLKKAFLLGIIVVLTIQWTLPGLILASQSVEHTQTQPQIKISRSFYTTVTAYSSTVEQTDSTPCITANGFNLCEHDRENVVAANSLPFGAKIRIPEYFGKRIFTVQDRMHHRFSNRIDVWMKERDDALEFGRRNLKIEIVAESNQIAKAQ